MRPVIRSNAAVVLAALLGISLLTGCGRLDVGALGQSSTPDPTVVASGTQQPGRNAPTVAPPIATSAPPPASVTGSSALAAVGDNDAVVRVYEQVSPTVVNITFSARVRNSFGQQGDQQGSGSGFIIDKEGHVVTNDHVVGNATRLDVTLADGTSYIGDVVAEDPGSDLAVVHIQAPSEKLAQLAVASIGDSTSLKVGQVVVAIGNPFGLERSASFGIVSSLGRVRPGQQQHLISNMIQTDAAINPGNSGGPLLNLQGQVIGINEQIEAPTQGNVGVGFAIPSNTLSRYLPQLLAGKQPPHAYVGISGTALTPTVAEQIRAPVQQGVMLATVVPNGPAGRAGLHGAARNDPATADLITQLDGRVVRSVEDLASYIDTKEPNDRVQVTYVRSGQTQTTDMTLGTWEPGNTQAR